MIRIPFTFTFFIGYNIKGKIYYVRANSIATILDYGLSHIKYQGEDYGVNNLYAQGIYGNQSQPLSDLYKLTLDSVAKVNNSNNILIEKYTDRLLKYFTR